jgi:hypothetical protein
LRATILRAALLLALRGAALRFVLRPPSRFALRRDLAEALAEAGVAFFAVLRALLAGLAAFRLAIAVVLSVLGLP